MSGRGGVAEFELSSDTAGTVDRITRLEDDSRWHVATRVTASKGFAKSKLLINFILYICEKHRLDQTDEITERRSANMCFDAHRGTTQVKITSSGTMPAS
jgi:F0F1-type ATP synthase delta subunit